MTKVIRTRSVLGRRGNLTTLEQQFRFTGASAGAVTGLLLTAPLTGPDSIFGDRPGTEDPGSESTRTLRGFSPAPGFRFDVELSRPEKHVLLVRFSQPDRRVPYLRGELVWRVFDENGAAVLEEQINTERAMEVASDPLTGPRPSLRRWLFFRAGHKQVMSRATDNLASLLDRHDS